MIIRYEYDAGQEPVMKPVIKLKIISVWRSFYLIFHSLSDIIKEFR